MKIAYVEPVGLGDDLGTMPLFLTPDGEGYVEIPVERTYLSAFAGVPPRYRTVLTNPG